MTAPATRARPSPRWIPPKLPDPDAVTRLTEELRLPPLVCALLVSRGYGDPTRAKAFLRPRLEQLNAPWLLSGMDRAVRRLSEAIDRGETILVHGDYDVDGICATTIMVQTVRLLGGTAVPFIPHRVSDGYDLSEAGVQAAVREGARVVVTCDCGTSAHRPVAELRARGIDVIITDHHLPSEPPPECLAVLNPRLPDSEYPDKDLCAAGVAFKLACALLEARGVSTNAAMGMLDLVALATVADVVPLRGENRVLARLGLRLMEETRNVGLRALIAATGLEGKRLTTGRIGFILAPRLNAVGRLGSALRGVELLLAQDAGEANFIARELEEMNRTRQALDRETLDEARQLMEGVDLDATFGIVLASPRWHAGVIGIVASRLVEEFCRPVILVSLDGSVGKGSGRSIPRFDLHAGLLACRDVLLRFGGHRAAAGLTIDAARMEEFVSRFNAVASALLSPEDLVPEIRVDAELPLDQATEDMERLMRHFEPFGIGNPAPLLVSRGVLIEGPPRVIGEHGLKLRLASGASRLEAVWWGAAQRTSEVPAGAVVDIAYRLERDTYLEIARPVANLVDVRR